MKIKDDLVDKDEKWQEKDLLSGSVERTPMGETYYFGLPQSKLDVLGTLPGEHMAWINEDSTSRAELGGYRYVKKGEVHTLTLTVPTDTCLDDRISTVVNPPADGLPVRAYLMAVSNERFEAMQAKQEERHRKFDQQVKRGADGMGHGFYNHPTIRNKFNPVPSDKW